MNAILQEHIGFRLIAKHFYLTNATIELNLNEITEINFPYLTHLDFAAYLNIFIFPFSERLYGKHLWRPSNFSNNSFLFAPLVARIQRHDLLLVLFLLKLNKCISWHYWLFQHWKENESFSGHQRTCGNWKFIINWFIGSKVFVRVICNAAKSLISGMKNRQSFQIENIKYSSWKYQRV